MSLNQKILESSMIEFSVAYKIEDYGEDHKLEVFMIMPEFSEMSIEDITENDAKLFGPQGLKRASYIVPKDIMIDNSFVLSTVIGLNPHIKEVETNQ